MTLGARKSNLALSLKENGDATLNTAEGALSWRQAGNEILVFLKEDPSFSYVFSLSQNQLTFIKVISEEGEIIAGQEFMDGIFLTGTLTKER
jgi:hypothetical protein